MTLILNSTPRRYLDFKSKPVNTILNLLACSNIYAHQLNGNYYVTGENSFALAQSIINDSEIKMPNLLPAQFKYLLAKNDFVPVIDTLLENVKSESVEKYARYYGFLKSATRYEYDLAYTMFDEIRDKFTAIDERFNFSDEQLRVMWMEASQV